MCCLVVCVCALYLYFYYHLYVGHVSCFVCLFVLVLGFLSLTTRPTNIQIARKCYVGKKSNYQPSLAPARPWAFLMGIACSWWGCGALAGLWGRAQVYDFVYRRSQKQKLKTEEMKHKKGKLKIRKKNKDKRNVIMWYQEAWAGWTRGGCCLLPGGGAGAMSH